MKKVILLLACLSCTISSFAQKKGNAAVVKTAPKTASKTASKKAVAPKTTAAPKTVAPQPTPLPKFTQHIAYIMGNNDVNLRNKPSTTGSDVLLKLATGSEVTVVKQTPTKMKVENVTALWYQVKIKQDTTETKGYVWGGYLSDIEADSKGNPEVHFMVRRVSDSITVIQAASTTTGKSYALLSVRTAFCETPKMRIATSSTITDQILLIGTCNDIRREELIIWDGKKLLKAGTAIGGGKIGTDPMREEHFILDGEKDGKKGFILKNTAAKIEWDGSVYRNATSSFTIYKWDGTQLLEQ